MNQRTRRFASLLTHSVAILLASILLASILIGACGESDADIANGDDPLRALTVAQRSDRYGSTYWTQKSNADSALWAEAVAYCEARTSGEHPNCEAVRQVRILEQMSRMHADQPNEFRLPVPQDSLPNDSLR